MAETPRPTLKRPWYSPIRLAQRALVYLLVAYLTLCAFLYLEQNKLEYPRHGSGADLPLAEAIRQASEAGLMPWDHPTPGAQSPQGYVPNDFAGLHLRGTIVVFHGNGSWAGQMTGYVDAFSRRGFRSFLYEYPGYGGRPGSPSEKIIVTDARALIYSLQRRGYGPIYVWGESLGSGVASAVCGDPHLPVRGLVLSSPWDTVADVGLYRYPYIPIRFLMTDKYDSLANLQHFRHPICVLRGTEDTIIPPALTSNLFAHLPGPKKLIIKQGYGHGDWPSAPELDWWDDALNFVAPR